MQRFIYHSGKYKVMSRSQPLLSSSIIRSMLTSQRKSSYMNMTSTISTYATNNNNSCPSSLSFISLVTRNFSSSSSSSPSSSRSPFDPKKVKDSENTESATSKKQHRRSYVPRIAAVQMTEKARKHFKQLLENPIRPDIIGIMLSYDQSKSSPQMVYTFNFVTKDDIDPEQDEGVSLEMVPSSFIDPKTGATYCVPKSPVDSKDDGLPKLYVHHNAFLKVLGATIDLDTETNTPILYDREGNQMDPNS